MKILLSNYTQLLFALLVWSLFSVLYYLLHLRLNINGYISLTITYYLCITLYGLASFGFTKYKTGDYPSQRIIGFFLLNSTTGYLLIILFSALLWFLTSGFFLSGVVLFLIVVLLFRVQ